MYHVLLTYKLSSIPTWMQIYILDVWLEGKFINEISYKWFLEKTLSEWHKLSRKISCQKLVSRTNEFFCNPRKFFYFKYIFVSYFNDIDGLSIVDLSRIKLFCQIMSHYNKSDSKQTQEVASAYFIPNAIRFAIHKIHVIEQIGLM